MNALRQPRFVIALATAGAVLGTFAYTLSARGQQPQEIAIKGDHFAFNPAEVVVHNGDLVKITFTAVDIPHSFTLDGFRIAKRAAAGQTVTFEFRADRQGSHEYYCNLSHDDRCRNMKGKLVVK